jgi:hypothetical protein
MLAAALAAEADAYLAESAGERDERSQRLVVRCRPPPTGYAPSPTPRSARLNLVGQARREAERGEQAGCLE